EHIIPHVAGGTDDLSNLALSCQGCNNHKYTSVTALDPVTGERVPLFHPRAHVWAEHFVWSEDFTLLIGLTPTGRATIQKLRLNRQSHRRGQPATDSAAGRRAPGRVTR